MTVESHQEPADTKTKRRSFLTGALAILCGGLATVPTFGAALWTFLDPLRRASGAATFLPLPDMTDVAAEEQPRPCPVMADRGGVCTEMPAGARCTV